MNGIMWNSSNGVSGNESSTESSFTAPEPHRFFYYDPLCEVGII